MMLSISRVPFSKTAHQDQTYHQQCLSFLVTGKCVRGTISLPERRHVNALGRGNLWKVNEDVYVIFSVVKAYFLSSTKKLQNEIVPKDKFSALMDNCTVLEGFDKVRRSFPDNIKRRLHSICWKTF